MLKIIKGIYLGLRTAPLWIKALDCAAKGDNEKSKKLLIRMEKLLVFSNVEYSLLRGYVEYKLGYPESSLVYLNRAIEKLPKERRCNDDELRYFKAYAQWLINQQEVNEERYFIIDFDSIKLNNIAKTFLENHPLSIHPNWKKTLGHP
jgi:hypothetical protein